MLSRICHETQIECQIMYAGNLESKIFLCLEEMVEICLCGYDIYVTGLAKKPKDILNLLNERLNNHV